MKKTSLQFTDESEKDQVRKLLKSKEPIVVRFYAEWCHVCKDTEKDWKNFCSVKRPYTCISVEENAIPDEFSGNIEGFPTYAAYDKKGGRHVSGKQTNLVTALKLMK